MHGGFVGMGMLDAACPGAVFTSPTPDQMLEATKAVDGGAGVLHIVKNYTGDILNFEMAADLARDEGIEVEAVVIDDDVAVQDSLYTAGRRGVGTTVLAEKICGAAAEAGRNLKEVADLCRKVNAWGRSMGMALTSCTVPHAGKPTFDLPENEMEIGIGIHGEPGRVRMPLKSADGSLRCSWSRSSKTCRSRPATVSCCSSTAWGYTAHRTVHRVPQSGRDSGQQGHHRGAPPDRPYITSLEMAGCSITLLKLDDDLIRLWDAPVKTPGMRWGV